MNTVYNMKLRQRHLPDRQNRSEKTKFILINKTKSIGKTKRVITLNTKSIGKTQRVITLNTNSF
jgi:hypothetical protein